MNPDQTYPVVVAQTAKIKIIAYKNYPGSSVWFYQCNIPYEHWTEVQRDYMKNVALFHQGLEDKADSYGIALGSGYFEKGMNEIYYLIAKKGR